MYVERVRKVLAALEHEAKKRFESGKGAPSESVIVGYTANYALPVHEIPPEVATHTVGQWKYLETPARNLANDGTLSNIVKTAMQQGTKMQQALYLAGLRIQRESQRMVPVDTGNLKGSAFTRKE